MHLPGLRIFRPARGRRRSKSRAIRAETSASSCSPRRRVNDTPEAAALDFAGFAAPAQNYILTQPHTRPRCQFYTIMVAGAEQAFRALLAPVVVFNLPVAICEWERLSSGELGIPKHRLRPVMRPRRSAPCQHQMALGNRSAICLSPPANPVRWKSMKSCILGSGSINLRFPKCSKSDSRVWQVAIRLTLVLLHSKAKELP